MSGTAIVCKDLLPVRLPGPPGRSLVCRLTLSMGTSCFAKENLVLFPVFSRRLLVRFFINLTTLRGRYLVIFHSASFFFHCCVLAGWTYLSAADSMVLPYLSD